MAPLKAFATGLTALILAAGPGPLASASAVQVISVSPADLRPDSRSDAGLDWFATPSGFYYDNLDFNNRYDRDSFAPLFLPPGARIKSLVVYYMDRGCAQAQDIRVSLVRQKMSSGLVQTMAEVTSHGLLNDPNRETLEDATIDHAVVDNARYSYSLLVRFNYIKHDRVRFHGAKIFCE
jgi:hypothetical protein